VDLVGDLFMVIYPCMHNVWVVIMYYVELGNKTGEDTLSWHIT